MAIRFLQQNLGYRWKTLVIGKKVWSSLGGNPLGLVFN